MQASRQVLRTLFRSSRSDAVAFTRVTCAGTSQTVRYYGKKETMTQKMAKQAGDKLLEARFIVPKGSTLPYTFAIDDGTRFRLENITDERAKHAWTIFNDSLGQGEGYSEGEIEPLDQFLYNQKTQNNYFELIHEEDDDIVAVVVIKDSPLARSEKTVHFGGPLAVNPKYRSKGYGRSVVFLVLFELGRNILKHPGIPAGRTVVAKSMNAVGGTGSVFHGMIPNCSYLKGQGWVHDLLLTAFDPRGINKKLLDMPVPEIPPLVRSDIVPLHLQSDKPYFKHLPQLTVNGHILNVELASSTDVWRVEEMIRQAAEDGDGFGLDEFNKDGHFNRKLFYHSHVVVAKSSDDIIIAAAIVGPNKLCRAYNEKQMTGYILVNKEFRRQGIGMAFTKYLADRGREAGSDAILTDTYASNVAAAQMMHKAGFMITGTLPHSGYLKNQGYTHTNLCWRSM